MRSETVFLDKEQIYKTTKSYFKGLLKVVSDSLGGIKISIANIVLFSKQYTKFCKIRLLGIPIYCKDLRKKWIKRILQNVDNKYDDIYLIRYNVGETVVVLSCVQHILRFYKSKNPLFIVFRRKDMSLYSMFLTQIKVPFQLIELTRREIYEIYDLEDKPYKIGSQRLIAPIKKISEQMMRDIRKGKDSNFYDFIIHSIGISKSEPMVMPCPSIKAINKVDQMNLKNVVILCPEATTVQELPISFWQELANNLKQKGYTVFVNAFKTVNQIKNTETAKLQLDELYVLSRHAAGIITMANGIAIMMCQSAKMDIIYTPYHENWFGYDSTNTLKTYSVKHLPNIKGDIKEYDTKSITVTELLNNILDRY